MRSVIGNILCILFLLMMAAFPACSKSTDNSTPVLPPDTPPTLAPSGEIETFILTDTLVAYHKGTTAKWNIIGTNSYTVVTFNGVKVAFSDALDTGPVTQTSLFTLAINNGRKATRALHVADSITSLLWNNGKRLKEVKNEVYAALAGSAPYWIVDTTVTSRKATQRIKFNLDGTSTLIQLASIPATYNTDLGRFTVNLLQNSMYWRGTTYLITTLDSRTLVVSYDAIQPNGTKLRTRETYNFE